jgi:hypothetical protein
VYDWAFSSREAFLVLGLGRAVARQGEAGSSKNSISRQRSGPDCCGSRNSGSDGWLCGVQRWVYSSCNNSAIGTRQGVMLNPAAAAVHCTRLRGGGTPSGAEGGGATPVPTEYTRVTSAVTSEAAAQYP